MAGTGPQVATTPLELLNNQVTTEVPLLVKHSSAIIFGALAFVGTIGANWITRRPIVSGIHRYAITVGSGIAIGSYIEQKRNEHLATRDAIFRHYMELHPEDFPPYERKQYKDVFELWIPVR